MEKHGLLTLWLLFLLGFLAAGCTDNNEENSSDRPSIEFTSGTDLKPVLATGGGNATLTFTATADWTAQVNGADWLTVSPAQGSAGTVTLQINAQANTTYDERNASVILTCGTAKETVTVTQKQQDALILTSGKVEMDMAGGIFSIELQSNVDVTYEIAADAQTWITPASSRGLTASTLSFEVADNPGQEARQGIITLRGNELTEQVTVYQEGSRPAIILSSREYTIASGGETIRVELKSNTSYQIQLPKVDWITESASRAFSTFTHYFDIATNDTYDARSAEILFIDTENGIEDKVTVTQVQKDAILVAQNEYTVDAAGGQLNFTVNANVDFNVEISTDWIQMNDSRGLIEKTLSFTIGENTTGTQREGTIIIAAENLKQQIQIIQEDKFTPEIEILTPEIIAGAEIYKVYLTNNIRANVEYTVSAENNDWLTLYSNGNAYLPANDTGKKRQVKITVSNYTYQIVQTFILTQESFNYLIPNQNYLYLSATDGNIQIPINTVQETSIYTDPGDWYTVKLKDNIIEINYTANTTNENRFLSLHANIGKYLGWTTNIIQVNGPDIEGNIDDIIHVEWK